ncbi:MAG: hypothetical protein OXU74_11225 [Gemmatimonadota bacterium]|nr:hypothetical protein [Gemmatimonadota bacterium]
MSKRLPPPEKALAVLLRGISGPVPRTKTEMKESDRAFKEELKELFRPSDDASAPPEMHGHDFGKHLA